MEKVIQLLHQFHENFGKRQSELSQHFLKKLVDKSLANKKETIKYQQSKNQSIEDINYELHSVSNSPNVELSSQQNEFYIPNFQEKPDSPQQNEKNSKQTSLIKYEDNPSVILKEEDFKVQNETVINILHNIDEVNNPKRKHQTLKEVRNSLSQQTLDRLPEQVQIIKQRQEKAKNSFYDKQAHKQAQQLILKLTRERRLQEENKMKKFQQQSEEMSYSIENIKRQREEQEEFQKLSKRKQILQKLQEDNIRRDLRKKINNEQNKLLKVIKKEIIKDQIIIQLSEQERLNQILNERKRVLAQRRELCKPFSIDEVKEHSRKHAEDIKILKLEREQLKLERDLNHSKKIINFPKTKFTVKVIKDDMQLKNNQIRSMEEKKIKRQRLVKYGEVVKDVFQPTVLAKSVISKQSEKQELLDLSTQNYYEFDEYVKVRNHAHEQKDKLKGQELIDHLKSAQFRGYLNSDDNLKKIQKVLKSSRLMVSSSPTSPQNLPNLKSKSSSKKLSYKPYTGKYNYSKEMQNKEIILNASKSDRIKMPVIAKENYLNELKQRRLEKEKNTNKKHETWQEQQKMKIKKYIKDILSERKFSLAYRKILDKSKAKQSEQLHREDEANKLYLDSIKTKLILLEQMKNK